MFEVRAEGPFFIVVCWECDPDGAIGVLSHDYVEAYSWGGEHTAAVHR